MHFTVLTVSTSCLFATSCISEPPPTGDVEQSSFILPIAGDYRDDDGNDVENGGCLWKFGNSTCSTAATLDSWDKCESSTTLSENYVMTWTLGSTVAGGVCGGAAYGQTVDCDAYCKGKQWGNVGMCGNDPIVRCRVFNASGALVQEEKTGRCHCGRDYATDLDGGDDPFTASCINLYSKPECNNNPYMKTAMFDRCDKASPLDTVDTVLTEYVGESCFVDSTVTSVKHDCKQVCKDAGKRGGTCQTTENARCKGFDGKPASVGYCACGGRLGDEK